MGKKPVKYCVVDAFTDSPFKGNPAAVCLLEEERDEEWLQAVASEFNISETCYLTRIADPVSEESEDSSHTTTNPRFRLRWFTPVAEVDLCGHATLAASHFLFTSGLVDANIIEFVTLSGVLIAKRVPEAKETDSNFENGESQDCFLIELDFPVVPLTDFDSAEVPSISKALSGASVIDIKMTTTGEDLFVVLPSGKTVADLQPQFDEIQRCPGLGLIITGLAPPGSGFDFISRCFYPKLGIKEDPVTGSAHCALAGYWSKKLEKCDFVAYAASPRGGILNLHLDEKSQRVLLRGKAVTTTIIEALESSSSKRKGRVDADKTAVLNAWHRVDCRTREALRRSFLSDLLNGYEECIRAFIKESGDTEVLVLHVQDPFHRLLLHGVCEFYNLVSVTVPQSKGMELAKMTRIKKKAGSVELPNITLCQFLKMAKEGIW